MISILGFKYSFVNGTHVIWIDRRYQRPSIAGRLSSSNHKTLTMVCFRFGVCVVAADTNKIISIPSEIGLLKNLEEFILSDNEITSIPTEIGSPGMNMRDLDFSKFSSFELDMPMVIVIGQGGCLVGWNMLTLVLVWLFVCR